MKDFIWNRVELLVTLSFDYYMQVRYLLQKHQIRNQSRRIAVESSKKDGVNGMLKRRATEFHIYVHQDDLERAKQLLYTIGPASQLVDSEVQDEE